MKVQVLNENVNIFKRIKKIAEKDKIQSLLNEIELFENSDKELTREIILHLIAILYHIVGVVITDGNIYDEDKYSKLPADLKELLINMKLKRSALESAVKDNSSSDEYKTAAGECLSSVEKVIKYVNANLIGPTKDDDDNEKKSKVKDWFKKIKDWFKKNGKTLAYAGGIVAVSAVIITCATKCSNNPKNKDNVEPTKGNTGVEDTVSPNTPQTPVTPGSTSDSELPVIPDNTSESELIDIDVATEKTYENWIKVTDKYDKETIKEVIKAINGLESSISLDEADEIISDVIGLIVVPKQKNLSYGAEFEPKTIDFRTLILNKKYVEDYALTSAGIMNNTMNNLIQGGNIEENANVVINNIVGALVSNTLDNDVVAARLLWARLTQYTNAIIGTLGEDYYVEVDGKLYTFNDILETSAIQQIAVDAKSEIAGFTR